MAQPTVIKLILLAAWLFAPFLCLGQQAGAAATGYLARNWTTEHGLPQNSGTAVAATSDGYLWVGTFNGLVRFNGLEFTRFTSGNIPDLQPDDITCLMEDSAGRLWIGAFGALLTLEGGVFRRWSNPSKLNVANFRALAQAADGPIYVAAERGVWRILGESVVELNIPNASWPALASGVAASANGRVWISHQEHLYEMVGDQLALRQSMPGSIGKLFVDRANTLWLEIAGRGLFQWRDKEGLVDMKIAVASVRDMLHAGNGILWIAAERDGLYLWRDGEIERFTTKEGLSSNRLLSLAEDAEGNIWVGTDGAGICRVSPKKLTVEGEPEGIVHPDVITILEDRAGTFWAGTYLDGLYMRSADGWQLYADASGGQVTGAVLSLIQTQDGTIWFGQSTKGLGRIRNNEIQYDRSSGTGGHSVRVLFEDSKKRLWIGTGWDGAWRLDGDKFTRFSPTNGLSHHFVTAIREDASGAIWVGTDGGLNRIQDGAIQKFDGRDGLRVSAIRCLLLDSAGDLWAGTAGGGIALFREGRFQAVTTAHGLHSDVVNQVIEDEAGHFWIGSTIGIFRVARRDLLQALEGAAAPLRCLVFGRKDGMRSAGCPGGFQPTTIKSKESLLCFSSGGGVVMIDPKNLGEALPPPPTHIEKMVIDGVETTPRAGAHILASSLAGKPGPSLVRNFPGPIRVRAGANRLEFHCAALSYLAPEQIQLKYWLEGYEDDWQPAGSRHVAYYSRVPPGDYRFHAKAAGQNGVWSDSAAILELTVEPLFWQTWWFRALLALLVLSVAAGIYYLRLAGARAVARLRLRVARDLHDEIASNLSNIALLSQLGQQSGQASTSVAAEFEEIRRVAIETINSVREITWFINPAFDTAEGMRKHLEDVAKRMLKGLDVSFKIEEGAATRRLSIAFRRNVLLIFKEALHNIVKHAQATTVRIDGRFEAEYFHLTIVDDGKGLAPSEGALGSGLDNMKQRAKELEGELKVRANDNGRGVIVELKARFTQAQ